MDKNIRITPEYHRFISDLKARVTAARISVSRSVNRDQIMLYWDIGRRIIEKQKQHKWGDSVIDGISRDLQTAFSGKEGFSPRNLRLMRQFYMEYAVRAFWQQAVAKIGAKSLKKAGNPILWQPGDALEGPGSVNVTAFIEDSFAAIPWGQHTIILNKIKDVRARVYYIRATARYGWSRNVLLNQIKACDYERAVAEKKTHNFPSVLPAYLAEQAEEALKSSYNLEFLGIKRQVHERVLENRLIDRLQSFIMELGYGFCFIGRQHRLVLEGEEYFIDLLFYHRFLKSLVAIELKVGRFIPEYAGKMDFYLNLLNEKEKAPADNPSIGIILCAEKRNIEVEFSLKSKANPIGVASYRMQNNLPNHFKSRLPTPKQLSEVVRAALQEDNPGCLSRGPLENGPTMDLQTK